MAGIYIPGIEMPIGHNEATFGIDADGHPLLAVYTENNPEPEIYSIIPVPDHGRLIEAERLKEVFHRNVVGGDAFDQLIDIAPTVIPADREGEA